MTMDPDGRHSFEEENIPENMLANMNDLYSNMMQQQIDQYKQIAQQYAVENLDPRLVEFGKVFCFTSFNVTTTSLRISW